MRTIGIRRKNSSKISILIDNPGIFSNKKTNSYLVFTYFDECFVLFDNEYGACITQYVIIPSVQSLYMNKTSLKLSADAKKNIGSTETHSQLNQCQAI